MANYMTRRQYDRHLDATRQCEEKLNLARKKVGEAASHGDLSENAEYDAAVEESGFLAGRVEELKSMLVGVQIVDPKNTVEGVATIGKTVELENVATNEHHVFHLVGAGSVDSDHGEVSFTAPLGKALIGARPTDTVKVDLPSGSAKYRVISIRHSD
jgi:transcription elongation factor GreA